MLSSGHSATWSSRRSSASVGLEGAGGPRVPDMSQKSWVSFSSLENGRELGVQEHYAAFLHPFRSHAKYSFGLTLTRDCAEKGILQN